MTSTTNIPLLLQCSCFTISFVLALVLLFARCQLRTESRSYETSRWMLFAGLTLFAVHYLLQMVFGFRASSEEVGALANILFYSPIVLLLVLCTLWGGLSCAVSRQRASSATPSSTPSSPSVTAPTAASICPGPYAPWKSST